MVCVWWGGLTGWGVCGLEVADDCCFYYFFSRRRKYQDSRI